MDRIALLEVYSVLAHDYGLYGIAARLDRMGFRGRPSLRYETLEVDQQEHYENLREAAYQTRAWETRLVSLLTSA